MNFSLLKCNDNDYTSTEEILKCTTRKIKIIHNPRKHDHVDIMNKKTKVDSTHAVIIPITQFVYLKIFGRLKSLLKPS